MADKRLFPWTLCLMLLGTYLTLIGGELFFTAMRRSEPNYFTAWVALLTFVALIVQTGALIWAGFLLVRQARYRSWMNLAFTIAGAVLPVVVLTRVMLFEGPGRFHM